MGPRIRFQGMNSAILCSLAGRYDNPLPPQFLAPIDSLKISALHTLAWRNRFLGIDPGLLKHHLHIRAQEDSLVSGCENNRILLIPIVKQDT
jgi:hypothetical protein